MSSPAPTTAQPSKKRKQPEEPPAQQLPAPPTKKAKRKKKKNENDAYDELIDVDLGINKAIALMDSQLICDHIAQKTKRFDKDLSELELEARYLPKEAVRCQMPGFDKNERTKENLVEFLKASCGNEKKGEKKKGIGGSAKSLNEAAEKKGSPHTLVIAAAGMRAADLVRDLRTLQKAPAVIAKLFAKHIKIAEAVDMCKKLRISIGVGTPQRIADLIDEGALKTENLRRIVVDASWVDVKKRGILDAPETQGALVKLLMRDDLKKLYMTEEGGEGVEIIFY